MSQSSTASKVSLRPSVQRVLVTPLGPPGPFRSFVHCAPTQYQFLATRSEHNTLFIVLKPTSAYSASLLYMCLVYVAPSYLAQVRYVHRCTFALSERGHGRRRERARIALYVYRITTYVAIACNLGAPLPFNRTSRVLEGAWYPRSSCAFG